ncbi:hypothetical protein ACFFTN_09800 [Aminobacter aganoensis]|uniref:Uncharacterized protein n=1 Tax=Aminobacter aganoensis TaxID=83264 RepID=A0A7X0FAW2_9HYPH|nr:hypothetical protein [Aminobacter aganoensis]MBB6356321.1 hypothetical protein [Aminobacter aganoensis]
MTLISDQRQLTYWLADRAISSRGLIRLPQEMVDKFGRMIESTAKAKLWKFSFKLDEWKCLLTLDYENDDVQIGSKVHIIMLYLLMCHRMKTGFRSQDVIRVLIEQCLEKDKDVYFLQDGRFTRMQSTWEFFRINGVQIDVKLKIKSYELFAERS